jgi:hypothetical protein
MNFMHESLWCLPNCEVNGKADIVKSLAIRAAVLGGVGALMFLGTVATTLPAAARCMVDEGNGRFTPCEALYKSKRCMIDEGNGRYAPCEALFKPKNAKKKG